MNHVPAIDRPFGSPRPGAPRVRLSRLRRLASMPLREVAGRSRQEAAKLFDRLTWNERTTEPIAVLEEHAPSLASDTAVLQFLRGDAPARFFAGIEEPARVGELFPGHREAVIKHADASLRNRFDLLGYRTLWFGDPIDWHLDPVWSRRAPRAHWTQIDPLDTESVGDSKIVWELNRHQWITRLAQAYALSGDERYAEHAVAAIDSWIDANPYGIGINWSSSLEAAYRVMSWSWTLLLLRNASALTAAHAQRVLGSIWLHANYVSRFLSHYFSPNTHLTGEALGLFYAGTLFTEFDHAASWRKTGAAVLVDQAAAQICSDGVHFERSACYHRYTLETYLQFLLLAERNGVAVPADVSDRVRRVAEFTLSVSAPDGALPDLGDADGGLLLPLVERQQCDPRGVLAVAAALFSRDDFAWAAAGPQPEVMWLMGEDGSRESAPRNSAPVHNPSRMFPSGGYAVMKSAWDRAAHYMVVDVGPLGCTFSCGHGHADLLSLQCSAFGERVLVDAGTYCYTPELDWRNHFRGTSAHNTLTIDGRSQVAPDGPFGWRGRARVQIREWRSQGDRDFVDGSHDAYPGLTHRRRVLFVKRGYWVVVDDVAGANDAAHQLDLGFQFAPMDVTLVSNHWARAVTPSQNTFWIGSFASSVARADITTGSTSPLRGWVSFDYGQRTAAPSLVYSNRSQLPWRAITLLLPQPGDRRDIPRISLTTAEDRRPIGLHLEDGNQSIFVDDNNVFLDQ